MPARRTRSRRYSARTTSSWNRNYNRRSRRANGKPWTPTEIKTLRKIYKDTPTKDIARRFSRSVSSVQSKAGSLGLKKTRSYMKQMRQSTWH